MPSLLEVIGPVTDRWASHGTADQHQRVRELAGAMSAHVLLGIAPGEAGAAQFTAAFEQFVAATAAPPHPP
ncbi:hypothetical protein [Streptomyces sp. NPDC046985]|uniref:hypothetical protein n=1 Tax=Streptomyces sp. NPDC046985 TaxID=3155377 RepID=UPI00340BEE12